MLAYAVNYAGMWVLLAIDGATWEETYNTVVVSNPMLKFTGQILYNAQFVGTQFSGDGGTVSTENVVTGGSLQENITSTVPEIGYHIVPILVLVTTGYLFYQHEDHPSSRVAAIMSSLEIVPGYLFLSILGVFIFILSGGFVVSRPAPLAAILLAGIVYPALWSGTGALIAYERHSE
jgi:hypothetical protein